VLAALSTGHQIGLGLSGLAFVAFSLTSAMLVPRRWPDFPGDKLGVFLAVCFVFFVGMLAAVFVFGKESSPPEKHHNAIAQSL
jgi:hypothetical protein